MTTAYISREALKISLKIGDDVDDDGLDRAILAASKAIDDKTGRTFGRADTVTQRTYRTAGRLLWTSDGWHELLVDDIATEDGLVVEVGSTGSWTAVSGWITGPDNAVADGKPITSLLHPTMWPCYQWQRVRVTSVHGWPSIPESVEQACLIQAGRLFRRKDSPEGVVATSEWGPLRVARLDPDVKDLLDPVTLPGFG
ncbi:phage gp6-like head-tail connector protein [Lentzea sp. NPDC059081]|uniref:phage gp6-like head-tail connector protein n=1 Tax=Lentzea sp. NPDC059081 TaxID=3346719 RepID=UPI00367381C9